MLGFMVLAQIILTGLTLSFPQSPIIQESYLILPLWLMGLLIFIRFGFGFLSRNFERQADCKALSRNGLTPIANALFKVSWINAIDPDFGYRRTRHGSCKYRCCPWPCRPCWRPRCSQTRDPSSCTSPLRLAGHWQSASQNDSQAHLKRIESRKRATLLPAATRPLG